MVKKSTLAKKLASYTTLATVVLAAAQESDGQVVYTKIDTTITTGGSYQLDITASGAVYDLHVNTASQSGLKLNSASIIPLGGDEVADTVLSFLPFAKPNVYKEAINSSDIWTATQLPLDIFSVNHSKNLGLIAGKDTYIALRSVSGLHFYFGWLRVNLNAKADTLIIKSYAYNSTSGATITAGDGDPDPISGIAPVTNAAAVLESLSPNPATTAATITYTIKVPGSVTLELYDITGRKIETLLNNAQQTPGRNRIPADVSGLSSGVYFYKLTVNGQAYTQKLVVAR